MSRARVLDPERLLVEAGKLSEAAGVVKLSALAVVLQCKHGTVCYHVLALRRAGRWPYSKARTPAPPADPAKPFVGGRDPFAVGARARRLMSLDERRRLAEQEVETLRLRQVGRRKGVQA